MNQFLDNIYSYNRKLFRNIPLSSILFGLITILIFTKPQLIGEININNYISSGVQKILNHLANTIYNPIFLLIIFITICFIASILNAIGHKLPTFKKKNLTFNNMGKITKIKSYNPYTFFEKNDFTNLFNLSTSSLEVIMRNNTYTLRSHLEILEYCVTDKNSVIILYRKGGDDVSQDRQFNPYRIIYWKNKWYLVAYCHLRDDV